MKLLTFIRGVFATFHYVIKPYDFYASVRHSGDPVRKNMILGKYFITSSAAGAKEVLTADPATFDVGDNMQVLFPVLGKNSIFLLCGKEHMAERKMLTPPFVAKNLNIYAERMRELTRQNTRTWQAGDRVVMKEMTYQTSLDIIIDVVFGVKDSAKAKKLGEALLHTLDSMGPSLLYFPFLRNRLYAPWNTFSRSKVESDKLIYEVIDKNRSGAEQREPGKDILSILLASTDEDGNSLRRESMRDHLVTMLAAGHETTGAGLSWATYHLLRNPECMKKLLAEIDALPPDAPAEAFAELPYLAAVCNETLRIYPIVLDIERKLRTDWTLLGKPIPRGSDVLVSVLNIHTDPVLYPEPECFRPERFIERHFAPWEFMPFGGGIRRCIGASLATYEMAVVLGTLLREWELELADNRPIRPMRRHVTLVPEGGVSVIVRGRRKQPEKAEIRRAAEPVMEAEMA